MYAQLTVILALGIGLGVWRRVQMRRPSLEVPLLRQGVASPFGDVVLSVRVPGVWVMGLVLVTVIALVVML
jgi:hypothetical protein